MEVNQGGGVQAPRIFNELFDPSIIANCSCCRYFMFFVLQCVDIAVKGNYH